MQIGRTRRDTELSEQAQIAVELAGLRAEVKALRTERDRSAEVNKLNADIEKLKLEKNRLTEDNDRKIRDTEHKVGLLKTQQDHDVDHARRMAVLEVREQNLDADRKRFEAEMKFQREHFERQASDIKDILGQVLSRLPDVTAAISIDRSDTPAPAGRTRRSSE